jgi:alpha-1,6-mannosyltransferase
MKLILPGAVLSLCVLSWARGGDATAHVGTHLALFGAAFFAYLLALHESSAGLSRSALQGALLLSILWRVLLVVRPPLLSDDVYRYVWEGRIQRYGGNPYAYGDRPESPRFAFLKDPVFGHVNHKDFAAIYPPLWQLVARGVVSCSDSVFAMKAFLLGCELLTWALLALLLRKEGLPPGRLLVLAWSPLALTEIAGSGHNEALGMLLLVLSLLLLHGGWPLVSAVAAALAFQAKLLPGIVSLSWIRRYRPAALLLAILVAGLLVLPYAGAGLDLLRSLSAYARFWRFNETLFASFAIVFGKTWAAPSAAAACLLFALFLGSKDLSPQRAGLTVVVAWLLLAPSVLPWYALWLLPFLVLEDEEGALLFTGTVSLAYLVYPEWQSTGRWQIGWGMRALEYLPPLGVGALHAFSRRGRLSL